MKNRVKSARGRKLRTDLKITCEILPPGTLKRKGRKKRLSQKDRWDEIVDICAEVIGDNND